MRVVAPHIGRRSSICSPTRTRRGQRTQLFWSSSFHEGISIITTSHQSRIRTTAEPHGRILHCKASTRVWWCMECKDSITIGRARNLTFRTNSESKQWPPLAGPVRKNCFLKNCKPAKALMTGGNFLAAFSKDRFRLANNVCKILWHLVTTVAYERTHALNQI